jgi:divalent metal cation (Fe/Co/Zn/Cd) transporter
VAFLILLVVFETIKEAIAKIVTPSAITFSIWVIVVLVLSVAVKLALYFYYKAMAKKIDSSILQATAIDSLSDCVSTSVVLISFFISKLVGYNIDGYAGVFVSFFIAYSAIGVLKEIFSTLIGKAPSEQMLKDIKEKVLTYPNVLGVHDLAVFSYGPNKYYASVHVEMDAKLDVLIAHEIVDKIEKDFLTEKGIILTGHLDPIITDDGRVNDLRLKIENILQELDSTFSLHDFRMVFGENRTNVLFDVAVPFSCKLTKEQIKHELEQKVALIDKKYCLVVTIEQCI